ncbi:hypothetical protein F4801DRAFT_579315 [Xylaria longipes]|nr:hypothetical protein F4801DRAFT_579315 [Xylaria longipes]RYC56829.1 hypothetical protein CHU98_g9373 [Xylaria longipes]
MSSRTSSVDFGHNSSNYSTVVRQDTFRSHKSKNHQGARIERESHGGRSVVYNHNARGFEKDAPTPDYHASSSYRK